MQEPQDSQSGGLPAAAPAPSQTTLKLLAASQPDIVRSVQKDDLYQQQITDSCYELVRSTFGAFTALQYSREIRLLSVLLYRGLTTGTGQATLGEEYCNMMQVTGLGRSPATARQIALVVLQGLGPYLADAITARMDRQLAATQQTDSTSTTLLPPREYHSHAPHTQHVDSTSGQQGLGSTASATGDPAIGSVAATHHHNRKRAWQLALPGRQLLQWLRTWWRVVVRHWERALHASWPHVRGVVSNLARLHLALFYLHGVFYSLAHRLADIRYAATARPLQGRPSYRVLGLLLVGQLGLAAALHLHQTVRQWSEQRAAGRTGGVRGVGSSLQHAQLLSESDVLDPDESDMSEESALLGWTQIDARLAAPETGPSGAVVPASAQPGSGPTPPHAAPHTPRPHRVQPLVVLSGRTCPLCLSPRKHPTSTPCGHVFCWDCVTQWCNEKPECPLCRARVLLPALVPVYHCAHF